MRKLFESLGVQTSKLSLQVGVILMLFFYLAVFVASPFSVPHSHHEVDTHESDLCTTDACHITIYHPGQEGGCKHKSHITQSEGECLLCHVVLSRQLQTENILFADLNTVMPCHHMTDLADVLAAGFHVLADRGPPSHA